jgi:hypothetical protein
MVIPIISIILGLVYIIKPNVFKLGFSRTTTVLSKNSLIYVRLLGVLFLGAGIWAVINQIN